MVFEATGAYHRGLEMALGKAGLPGVKINPLQARRFAEATGRRAKTDRVDAAMLARFGATLQPDILPVKNEAIDTLGELLGARRALLKDRTAALNRGKTLTLALLKGQSDQHMRQIDSQIKAIDQEQASILTAHPSLKARFNILVSMPGLGDVTALALVIGMPELGFMDAKQTASLTGLAVLRQALYMPALVAIRFNPQLKAQYLAMRKAGKHAKVAIVAGMRKIIITANALLRDNRPWTEKAA
jgi:transposase